MNRQVLATIGKITLPTYPEPPAEEMPMFAENRVHQRTSGNPWPNRVVLGVNRRDRAPHDHTCVRLENEFLALEILPDLGGRIHSARDKTTGYDFFYKQHVIKPALIGCLGSWISGGLEFNWPFHHRPSTFMPVDFHIEHEPGGAAIVWLSEHDPMERMKGMVGIRLAPGEALFETRVKLANRTPLPSSFLWWENTAVPVNESYQIFFPPDVSHVHFHYKRSVTTFPVASNATGVFNGIRYNGPTDISFHKNTLQPTSYFSAESKHDFFGGYDHSKNRGVVHVASRHISPGKKMFTWAYNQLSHSWENALTDSDGPYAELMAGCFSDNQPDFSWIEPFETKNFSQFWFPISNTGIPLFANTNGAIHWDASTLKIQTTRAFPSANITVRDPSGQILLETSANLLPGQVAAFNCAIAAGNSINVSLNGKSLLFYTHETPPTLGVPDPAGDLPDFKSVKTAGELYRMGLHVWQYRDPAILPDVFWKEALARDPGHADSLLALAGFYYKHADLQNALACAEKARDVLTRHNQRTRSGALYYLLGLVYTQSGDLQKARDFFHKSAWNMDYHSAAMTRVAALDGRLGDLNEMRGHSAAALLYNAENPLASVYNALAALKLGDLPAAVARLETILKTDPLNHLARLALCLCGKTNLAEFIQTLRSDPSQTALDLAFDLAACGMEADALPLLRAIPDKSPSIHYLLGDYKAAETAPTGKTFPFRIEEAALLEKITRDQPNLPMARYYYGCLLYAKGAHAQAAAQFKAAIQLKPDFYVPYRNLAVANYSHLNQRDNVLPLLKKALELRPGDAQLVFETAHVMAKLGVSPAERIQFILANTKDTPRDDVCIELARAYNQNGDPEKTLELYEKHTFVPCEGGEHATAGQYMDACHIIGRKLLRDNKFKDALAAFRAAQVLPRNLGAGLWHEARLVPHQYHEALCLDALGETEKAALIYNHISNLAIDYFSNMHLPELPYYKAMALSKTGAAPEARALMDACLKKWTNALGVTDPGWFATTPFFISYCDAPARLRAAYYNYLLGFVARFANDAPAARLRFRQAAALDPHNNSYHIEEQLTIGN
ncbi:MAG: DUF5107 domain-containing protein [Opitutaceae bacterium]|jgi:tetratricopeptide (TPR) repeat protein|nr:DUF5107 domain-containing protein [Opitutaceae bacterium]